MTFKGEYHNEVKGYRFAYCDVCKKCFDEDINMPASCFNY